MPDSQNSRVAVYLDFDNIVISWYDRVHGRNSYGRDRQRIIESPAPRMRYAPGPLRHRAGIVLKGLLPWRLMEWAFHQYLKRA